MKYEHDSQHTNIQCSKDYLFYHCLSLKSKLVVIVQVCELLLRHLHPTGACDVVDPSFSKDLV